MFNKIKCEICGKGYLINDTASTINAWLQPENFKLDNIDKIVDGIIGEVLCFNCSECKAELRYTYKELEKLYRKKLSDKLLTMLAKGEMADPGMVRKSAKIFIYCGKCSGFDGKGTCPEFIYKECKLKRLPWDRPI